jgi:hypothetical protein
VDDPSAEELAAGRFKTLSLTIDELNNGDILADFEILQEKKVPVGFTAITAFPTTVVYIEKVDLLRILREDDIPLRDIWNAARAYPADSKIRELFFQRKIWKGYKKKFFQRWAYDKKFKGSKIQRILDRDVQIKQPRRFERKRGKYFTQNYEFIKLEQAVDVKGNSKHALFQSIKMNPKQLIKLHQSFEDKKEKEF